MHISLNSNIVCIHSSYSECSIISCITNLFVFTKESLQICSASRAILAKQAVKGVFSTSVSTTPTLMTLTKPKLELHFVRPEFRVCDFFLSSDDIWYDIFTARKTVYHRSDLYLTSCPQGLTYIFIPQKVNKRTKKKIPPKKNKKKKSIYIHKYNYLGR